jgi:sporulation protein YlmC with PRC-barrel domain
MTEQFCSVSELRSKEVVNVLDGYRLGLVHDVNFDLSKDVPFLLIVLGARRFFRAFWA